jgi:hypothetical protein
VVGSVVAVCEGPGKALQTSAAEKSTTTFNRIFIMPISLV